MPTPRRLDVSSVCRPRDKLGFRYNLHSLAEAEAEAEAEELSEAEAEAEAESEAAVPVLEAAVVLAAVVLAAAVVDEAVVTVVTLMPAEVASSLSAT